MRPEAQKSRPKVCCIGEVLWDALPEGLFLGGAPLNVCCNLAALGQPAHMISRVGRDRLGREALRHLQGKGVETGCIQLDEEHETGFVEVSLSEREGPAYTIIEPVAWDFIEYSEEVQRLGDAADVVVFGTLAQRNPESRRTIARLIDQSGLSVYDINLRPPYDDRKLVEQSLRRADIVKMNREELMVLAGWFGYSRQIKEGVEELAEVFGCQQVCVTSGKDGASLFNRGSWTHQSGFDIEVVDTIGSGDAFLAAFIYGLKGLENDRERLLFANLLGAFVATRPGANSSYSLKDIAGFARLKGAGLDIDESLKTGSAE